MTTEMPAKKKENYATFGIDGSQAPPLLSSASAAPTTTTPTPSTSTTTQGDSVRFETDADPSSSSSSSSVSKQRPRSNSASTKRGGGGGGGGGMHRTASVAHLKGSDMRSDSERRKVQENQDAAAAAAAGMSSNNSIMRIPSIPVVFPWSWQYKAWWGLTVLGAVAITYFETYELAFGRAGLVPFTVPAAVLEFGLTGMFVVDIVLNFRLAYYDERDEIVYDAREIAVHYVKRMFWIDLTGVFPFYPIALAIAGEMGQDSKLAQYLALFRLFKLVWLYRVKHLFDALQYSTQISLMWLTVSRNFSAALLWTHFSACVIYFIARQYDFDPNETWIGGQVQDLNSFERYTTSLYWSVVTFTTVGYGDFSPVNPAEQIWGMTYMLLNIVLHSWIIGSITLLVVKNDEKTGDYREALQVLDQYSTVNSFDDALKKRLKTQLNLDFSNREISDEQVLKHFPSSVRRKVLRKLYLPSLVQTSLMQGVRQQFVDAFLTTCNVEIFTPGEEILQRGSISSDLYLLVEGVIKLLPFDNSSMDAGTTTERLNGFGSVAESEVMQPGSKEGSRELGPGEFINEIGFFTESPQIDTVRTVSLCKTLTMSRSAYKMIAQDHPGSVGKILQNLLHKLEEMATELGSSPRVNLPTRLSILRAGSAYDDLSSHTADIRQSVASIQTQSALTATQDLVKMHINRQKDDHTTRFLFAASRDDIATLTLMCDHGLDPNSADYDSRTALMVAAMKGNTEAIVKILEYGANPNLVDMHGTSALYETAKNGHEVTMEELLKHDAKLCMDESQAASTLCQAVFDGDILTLRRLLRANIQVNAGDYDKRTAAHIAAAEGNVAALRLLHEFGADLDVKDRWDNTIYDEARKALDNAGPLLEFLASLEVDEAP